MNNPALVKRAGLLGMLLYSESLGDGTLPKGLRGTKTTPEMINRLKTTVSDLNLRRSGNRRGVVIPQYLAAPSAQPTDKMLSPLFSNADGGVSGSHSAADSGVSGCIGAGYGCSYNRFGTSAKCDGVGKSDHQYQREPEYRRTCYRE